MCEWVEAGQVAGVVATTGKYGCAAVAAAVVQPVQRVM